MREGALADHIAMGDFSWELKGHKREKLKKEKCLESRQS